jgi:hypothetical protein
MFSDIHRAKVESEWFCTVLWKGAKQGGEKDNRFVNKQLRDCLQQLVLEPRINANGREMTEMGGWRISSSRSLAVDSRATV